CQHTTEPIFGEQPLTPLTPVFAPGLVIVAGAGLAF
ncbi:MAG: hypothetical protein RL747_1060, partial [Bacteroidota bacterium]